MSVPRSELKYWASAEQQRQLLEETEGLLVRDAHATDERPAYTVTSLYFDTADLAFFWEKIEGVRDRVKIRLRRYGTSSDGFAEVKLKGSHRIRKLRVPLAAEELRTLAEGGTHVLPRTPEAARLRSELGLRALCPTTITRYEREAWVLADDPATRLTFDRALSCWSDDPIETFFAPEPAALPMFEPDLQAPGIVELKFTGPVPRAVARALRRVGLIRRAISKYCLAVRRTRSLPVPLGRLLPARPWVAEAD